MKQYKFRAGTGKDAQVFGKFVEKLDEKGVVKPEEVVKAAKPSNSPIHEYFDWDDSSAAQKHRLWQARFYLGQLEVEVSYPKGKLQKAYFSVNTTPANKKKKRAYVVVDKVMASKDLRTQVLQRAMREVIYWENKYTEYLEFSQIFEAISKTRKNLKGKV